MERVYILSEADMAIANPYQRWTEPRGDYAEMLSTLSASSIMALPYGTSASSIAFRIPTNAKIPVRTSYTGANAFSIDPSSVVKCSYCGSWAFKNDALKSCRNCGANDYE